jgi:RNA polymerase sigma-70 factor (ECF subfamily)
MLGSVHEAEDAVQETLLRAWRAAESYEGRASVRSWLYRIATNVSLDAIKRRKRRQRPVDLGPAGTASAPVAAPVSELTFIEPIPDVEALPAGDDPAADIVMRESIRLAFVAALQLLPARQRAVLILREVLRWPATDVAELLDTSVASVNSALQRARATLAEQEVDDTDLRDPADEGQRVLLDRYVDAFERYDLDALVGLLHEDLVMSMPPYDLWLEGPEQLREWFLGHGKACRGSVLIPVEANASPAYAQFRPTPGEPGRYHAWAIQVLEIVDGRITALTSFLDKSLFGRFGLPLELER